MNEDRIGKAVLVVDDDPKNLELLAVKLSQEGYRVITAQSGKDALESIKLEKPGLVLLDIMMPEMNGIETLQRIKALEPSIPVAMVTAVWDEDEARKAIEAGAYEYITKPIDMEHLRLAVLVKLFPEE
jgi:two-component system sensor histidine kinase ChiS